MYAIVDYKGTQVKVEKNRIIYLPYMESKNDSELILDKVIYYADDEKSLTGAPYLKNIKVETKFLYSLKDKKVVALRYKPRKNKRVKRGHRQKLSKLLVKNIVLS